MQNGQDSIDSSVTATHMVLKGKYLVQILKHAVMNKIDIFDIRPNLSLRRALTLRCVCRHWRDTIDRDPSFWKEISGISTNGTFNFALDHTRGISLDLYFHGVSLFQNTPLFQSIVAQASRWKTLALNFNQQLGISICLTPQILSQATLLTSVSFTFPLGHKGQDYQLKSLFEHAPSVTRLKLETPGPLEVKSIPWGRLTHINLGSHSLPFVNAVAILYKCRNAQVLSLRVNSSQIMDESYPEVKPWIPIFNFPYLTHLRLVVGLYDLQIVQVIKASNLQEFELSLPYGTSYFYERPTFQWDLSIITRFIDRMEPTKLKRVMIYDFDCHLGFQRYESTVKFFALCTGLRIPQFKYLVRGMKRADKYDLCLFLNGNIQLYKNLDCKMDQDDFNWFNDPANVHQVFTNFDGLESPQNFGCLISWGTGVPKGEAEEELKYGSYGFDTHRETNYTLALSPTHPSWDDFDKTHVVIEIFDSDKHVYRIKPEDLNGANN